MPRWKGLASQKDRPVCPTVVASAPLFMSSYSLVFLMLENAHASLTVHVSRSPTGMCVLMRKKCAQ